jgi:hypothetical protein
MLLQRLGPHFMVHSINRPLVTYEPVEPTKQPIEVQDFEIIIDHFILFFGTQEARGHLANFSINERRFYSRESNHQPLRYQPIV